MRKSALLIAGIAAVALFILASRATGMVEAATPQPDTKASCHTCHAQEGLTLELASGEKMHLQVEPDKFEASTHGQLQCSECHSSIPGFPHPQPQASSVRDYQKSLKDVCMECHPQAYSEMEQTLHRVVKQELLCTDCHDSHYTAPAAMAKAQSSAACGTCHEGVIKTYAGSVHGQSLTGGTADLPSCFDCHGAHEFGNVPSPMDSVATCGACHSNGEIMVRYGLTTNVLATYLDDFHGKTAVLTGKASGDAFAGGALCTDCHGIHNIQKVDVPTSSVVKANLVTTCQKCHPDATENFPAAWLSHYGPSPSTAPLVFLATWFYRIMIPFIVVGLLIHIVLDIRKARREKGGQHAS